MNFYLHIFLLCYSCVGKMKIVIKQVCCWQVVDVTYGLFVWPCAPLLAKYVFYREDTVADKHVLEVGAQTLMYFVLFF